MENRNEKLNYREVIDFLKKAYDKTFSSCDKYHISETIEALLRLYDRH